MPHPSPIACTACRRSHLRCDAKAPICSRCLTASLQFNYTPSQRGIRKSVPSPGRPPSIASGSRLVRSPSESSQMGSIYPERPYWTSTTAAVFSAPQWSEYPSLTANDRLGRGSLDENISQTYPSMSIETESLLLPPLQQHTPPPADIHDDHLVNLFYSYFQPAHPILLPRHLYTARNYPAYVRHVVHFIGSQCSPSISSDSLATIAVPALKHDGPKTPLLVQARLLYGIALHGWNDLDGFQSNLTHAITSALELYVFCLAKQYRVDLQAYRYTSAAASTLPAGYYK